MLGVDCLQAGLSPQGSVIAIGLLHLLVIGMAHGWSSVRIQVPLGNTGCQERLICPS